MGLEAAGGEQDCQTAKDLDLCGDESAEGALTKKYCPKTCGTCTEALITAPISKQAGSKTRLLTLIAPYITRLEMEAAFQEGIH